MEGIPHVLMHVTNDENDVAQDGILRHSYFRRSCSWRQRRPETMKTPKRCPTNFSLSWFSPTGSFRQQRQTEVCRTFSEEEETT